MEEALLQLMQTVSTNLGYFQVVNQSQRYPGSTYSRARGLSL